MEINISDMGGFDSAVEYSRKYGFGFEVQHFETGEALDSDDMQNDLSEIKKKTEGLSSITVHGPFYDLIPASRDRRISDVTLFRFNQSYKVADELRADHIIFHSGFVPETCPEDLWLKNSIHFWNRFLSNKSDDIKIHIENVYEENYELLYKLVKKIDRDHVSLCLDVGHVNIYSSRSIDDWVEGLNSKIGYVHLHNNDGKSDDHLGFNEGSIDMKHILSLLDEYCPNAVKTLEVFEIYSTIKWLQVNGYIKKT
jgi:sugar phosphate isomerase/epimerase